jgi:hypothetical protein
MYDLIHTTKNDLPIVLSVNEQLPIVCIKRRTHPLCSFTKNGIFIPPSHKGCIRKDCRKIGKTGNSLSFNPHTTGTMLEE